MAESLLLPVVSAVAGKAADELVKSVTGMRGIEKDRRKLERHLLAVQCKLVDAEVKSETNTAIKEWMKDLKAVAYEADDVLDHFRYEALRREAHIGDSTSRKVLSCVTEVLSCVTEPCIRLKFSFSMSRKLNDVLNKMNELVVEMDKYRLVDNHAEAPPVRSQDPPPVLSRETHAILDKYSEILGRDGDKEEVVKMLLDQRDHQEVQVLPTVGMGGLGKTTLAKMLYNDDMVQAHFELKMWHCVSEDFDACHIIKSIIELAKGGPSDTIQKLATQLPDAIVFPKDDEMEKDMLIQLWMANGFIQGEGTMDLVRKGERIFHDLVWRSFLQDVKATESFFRDEDNSIVCKMHDLMHDLAKGVTDECATIEELIQRKVSIQDVRHMEKIIPKSEQDRGVLKGSASLRTLLEPINSHKDLHELRLVSLRVLCCENPSIINSQVINGKHLRYLDLSESDIEKLPDSICVLYNLQTLKLNFCKELKYLPDHMRTMRKLIHLYLFECTSLERMPRNVGQLENLHTLTTFVVDTEAGRGIEELKDLRHIANTLELYNLRKVKSCTDAKEANLHLKQNLSKLLLCWGLKEGDIPNDMASNEEQVFENLAPHSRLEVLEVDRYGGVEISQWMRDPDMFLCLKKLHISNCPNCKDLPVVWIANSLEDLCLSNIGSITTLYNSPHQIFPKLKNMDLEMLPKLERLAENRLGELDSLEMFPILEELSIIDCPKLVGISVSIVLKNLSNLKHLILQSDLDDSGEGIRLCPLPSLVRLEVSCLANMMMMLPLEEQQNRSQAALKNLGWLRLHGPNCFATASTLSNPHLGLWECFAFVEELEIWNCYELVCWPTKELRCLIRLRKLCIAQCDRLEGKGPSSEEIPMLPASLEKLSVDSCGSLLEIPMLPASLEELHISNCRSLAALPSNLGNLGKLRALNLWDCSALRTLPHGDGMGGLTSL